MKILKFLAENIKGIKVVQIEPNGDVVTISGKNGAGKSSVLDSIEATLCGGDLPLSNGSEKGKVEIDLGDCIVSRIVTGKTDKLYVKNKDGATYSSPREFLSKFIGALSIDPLAFIRLDEKKQLEVLFKMCSGLKAGLEEAERKIERIRVERQQVNRDKSRLDIEIDQLPSYPDAPEFEVDVVDLSKTLADAKDQENKIQGLNYTLKDMQARIKTKDGQIALIKKDILALQQKLESEIIEFDKIGAEIAQILEKINAETATVTPNIPSIMQQIEQADSVNAKIKANELKAAKVKERERVALEFSEGLKKLKDAEEEKSALLSNAKLPLPGISVQDGLVIYKGIPISQLSTGEKVRVGASLAVSQNPQAKIILASEADFWKWFGERFEGKIIHWMEKRY